MEHDKKRVFDYLQKYLGQYNVYVSPKEEELFTQLNIESDKSYLVYNKDYNTLKKFVSYYLTLRDYDYISYDFNDYTSNYTDPEKDIVYSELLILRYHSGVFEFGKAGSLLRDVLVSTITSRNRAGLITLVLAEKDLPYLNNSPEIRAIKLGDVHVNNYNFNNSNSVNNVPVNSTTINIVDTKRINNMPADEDPGMY